MKGDSKEEAGSFKEAGEKELEEAIRGERERERERERQRERLERRAPGPR